MRFSSLGAWRNCLSLEAHAVESRGAAGGIADLHRGPLLTSVLPPA